MTTPPARTPFHVRLVERDDLATLHANCLSGWPLDQLRAEVESNVAKAQAGERFHFVAIAAEGELRGQVIGTAYLDRRPHPMHRHQGELVGVSVTPPWQRKGVARALTEAVSARAAALGMTQLLTSCRGGTGAETVWKRIGFVEYGREPAGLVQSDGKVFDSVLLWRPVREEVAWGITRAGVPVVRLIAGGVAAGQVELVPQTVRYGAATLAIAHIAGVETEAAWRNRGYARRLMVQALDRARAGGAALSLLYGIGDFYPKFGYATVGADFGISLRNLEDGHGLSEGWTVRPVTEAGVPAVASLYDAGTAGSTMQKVRSADDPVWGSLRALTRGERPEDACRVVEDPHGEVAAYAWIGRGYWTVDHAQERYWPDDLTIGEVVARDAAAADAVLAACRLWGLEEQARRGKRIGAVRLGAAPGGTIASAAQHAETSFTRTSWRSAGPQARVLDALALLRAIAPELSRRVASLAAPPTETLSLVTDAGSATLDVSRDTVTVSEPSGRGAEVRIAQTTLMRLVLGAFDPPDLLARSEPHVDARARAALAALFPQRTPFMYPLDRP